jgi:hypothetical protein
MKKEGAWGREKHIFAGQRFYKIISIKQKQGSDV